jgi:small-conductance mechanosensitive channel
MPALGMRAARPHLIRASLALIVAIGGMILADFGGLSGAGIEPSDRLLALGGTAVVLVAGIVTVRSLAEAVRRGAGEHAADARAATLAVIATVVGYALLLLAVLGALGRLGSLRGLLLGGAVTGIVIGIAAQQTLANFFAGLVLLMVRPFRVGEHVIMRSGPLGGEFEGRVIDIGLYYVTLLTELGPVDLPNAGVLASAIGPGARTSKAEPDDEDATEPPKESS